jgi:SSS family solute:Na+ symporter
VSGALNSISTLVSYDLYQQLYPKAPDKQLVRTGKISALAALVFSIALLPLLNRYESIFLGINDVIAHIAPPITCVFLLGVFWHAASATAARLTLWLGSLLGAGVFAINKMFPLTIMGQIPFLMMAFYLFIVCVVMQVAFSYMYPVVHTAQSNELYWRTWKQPLQSKGWSGIGNYKLLSALLLLIMGFLYYFFN